MRRIILTVAAFAVAALGWLAAAAPAGAATAPTPKITGSVSLAAPAQYESIGAFVGDKGSVSYTNFTCADPGSGVWSLHTGSNIAVQFGLGGGTSPHTIVIDSVSPTGLASYSFTGHGSYDPDASYTWTATGTVSGTTLSLHVTYTGSNAGYGPDNIGRTPGIWDLTSNSFRPVPGMSDPAILETSMSVLLPPAQAQRYGPCVHKVLAAAVRRAICHRGE